MPVRANIVRKTMFTDGTEGALAVESVYFNFAVDC